MQEIPHPWEKLGRIITPIPEISWLSTYTGASFANPIDGGPLFDVYITGRDDKNRSQIGHIKIDIDNPLNILEISPTPVLTCGELGAFDENGVSYPSMLVSDGYLYMYYVGWMPSVLVPFQNHTGLARSPIGCYEFQRVSRAPILPRTNSEPFGTGSVCVMKEGNQWRLWYTVWKRWGRNAADHKHYYIIRHAESEDGINWRRNTHNCIDYKDDGEYAIGKPSVVKVDGTYHMWYVYRGKQYRIGYASSKDGVYWNRMDELVGIDVSDIGWDSKAISYPHVFQHREYLYMLYCGNEYGKAGLGLAKLKL